VGAGVGVGTAVGVGVGDGVGVGVAVGLGVGTGVGTGVGVGATVWFAMTKDADSRVVLEEVLILAEMVCVPSARVLVFQGFSMPVALVPVKSNGALLSMLYADLVIEVSSSQKVTLVTLVLGVTKTYRVPASVAPTRATGVERFALVDTAKAYGDVVPAWTANGMMAAAAATKPSIARRFICAHS
jgi:hypothetical protein